MRMKQAGVWLIAATIAAACHTKKEPVDDPNRPGAEERALLESATELTLFAIDPRGDAPNGEVDGYPIRKTVVIPRAEIAQVAKAVAKALGQGPEANCFEPHHALRVVSGGQTVDLVICFACQEVEVVRGGQHVAWIATDRSAELALGKYVGRTPSVDASW
jgi:hypothetical protein